LLINKFHWIRMVSKMFRTFVSQKTVLVAAIAVLMLFSACGHARAQALPEQVSRELEFVQGVLKRGLEEGNMERIAEAHRILSNLEVTLGELSSPKKKTMFTLALGYEYVNMCPSVFLFQLSSPDNPTGFTIDCVEKSLGYFSKALDMAEKNLTPGSAADAFFIAGVGVDRLKANLTGVPGAETEKYFKMAREYIRMSAQLGPTFDGIDIVLKRFDRPKFRELPIVSDSQFETIQRMLVYDSAYSVTETTPGPQAKPVVETPSGGKSTPPAFVDDNSYVNYRWRFSIRRPDDSWEFVTNKTEQSLHLTIKKKNPMEQPGSGLNVICYPLSPSDSNAPLKQIVDKSTRLLEQAGYTVSGSEQYTLSGMPAFRINARHTYNELIPADQTAAGSGASSSSLVSRQFMIVTARNGIQYILSFSALENDFNSVFETYRKIADTISFY